MEKAYRAILDQVTAGGGRIVSSQLNRPKPDQTTGTISFEVAADKAEVLLAAVRGNGDVMRMEVTQNPDTQNVTEAKRGFAVQVYSLASVAPRETTSLQVAASSVQDAFNKLLEAAKAGGGRIITSQLNEQDQNNVNAQLDFDVMREQWGKVEAALREAGLVVTRTVARCPGCREHGGQQDPPDGHADRRREAPAARDDHADRRDAGRARLVQRPAEPRA